MTSPDSPSDSGDFDTAGETLDSSSNAAFDPGAQTLDGFDPAGRTLDSASPTAPGSAPPPPADSAPPPPTDSAPPPPTDSAPLPPAPGRPGPPRAGDFRELPTMLEAGAPMFAPGTTPPGATPPLISHGDREEPISHMPTLKDSPAGPARSATWHQVPTPSEQPATHAQINPEATDVYPMDSTQGGGGRLSSGSGLDASLATAGRATDARQVPSVPTQIGDYQILRELGRGGMGVVYEALSVTLGRKVALKVLLSGTGATEHDRARFLVEAKAASMLRHPNIVRVLEYRQDGNETYLAMDMIQGASLQKRVEEAKHLTDRRSAEIALTMAEALVEAHGKGVLHRDIKPHNVLLDETQDDAPMLTDFGLAKLLEDQGISLTADGPVMMGTPGYMPPEQAGAGFPIDRRADVYSLGATLYFMLTGRPPFQGKSMPQVLMAVVRKRPDPPSQRRAGVAPALETICLKCLEKDPQDRYDSARELADDLRRFLDDERIRARRVGTWQRAQRWTTRNPLAAAASLGALVVSLSVVGWGVVQVVEARRTLARQPASPSPVSPSPGPSASPAGSAAPSPQASETPGPSPSVSPSPPDTPPPPPPDTTAPQLQVVSPRSGLVTTAELVLVEVIALDEGELDQVEINGEAFQPQDDPARYALPWELVEGEQQATIVARDMAGNETTATVTVVRDSLPPQVEALRWSPSGPAVEVDAIEVTVILSEPAEGAIGGIAAVASQDDDGRGLLTARVPLTLGVNALDVSFVDAVGNAGSHSFEVERALHRTLRGAWWNPPLDGPQAQYAVEHDLPLVIEEQGLTFVLIPPGSFWMGSPPQERPETGSRGADEALHRVEISAPFYLSAHEVTNARYRDHDPSHDSGTSRKIRGSDPNRIFSLAGDRQPAVGLSWQEANRFCEALSAHVEHPGRYTLPTEAQWEYACRAGTRTRWPWGEEPDEAHRHANAADRNANAVFRWARDLDAGERFFRVSDPHEVTADVGSYEPNAWGLYDMIGNANEWVYDGYDPTYDTGPSGDARDPRVDDGEARVYRGGSFLTPPPRTRSASRAAYKPILGLVDGGFRVARVVEPR